MEEVNNYIIKTDPYKKRIKVSIDFGIIGKPGKTEEFVSVYGVNKSIRPITVRSYGFQLLDKNDNEWLALWLPAPNYMYPTTIFNTPPKTKLQDGDSCSGYYPLSLFREDLLSQKITLPSKIKGVINTNDGVFYSKEKDLKEDMIS